MPQLKAVIAKLSRDQIVQYQTSGSVTAEGFHLKEGSLKVPLPLSPSECCTQVVHVMILIVFPAMGRQWPRAPSGVVNMSSLQEEYSLT